MKTLYNFFASKKLALILMLIISIAIAIATFIEEAHDTETAKLLVYSSRWFEVLLFMMSVNLIVVLYDQRVGIKNKPGIFLIHVSIIIMLIGAALTRYVGYEGVMHIREGQQSNTIFTYNAFLKAKYEKDGVSSKAETPITSARLRRSPVSMKISTPEGSIHLEYKNYIPRALKSLVDAQENGKEIIELFVSERRGNSTLFLEKNEYQKLGETPIGFDSDKAAEGINIRKTNGELHISSQTELIRSTMQGIIIDTMQIDSAYRFDENTVYNLPEYIFALSKYKEQGAIAYTSHDHNRNLRDIMVLEAEYQGEIYELNVPGGSNFTAEYESYQVGDTDLQIAYGIKAIELPFALQLENFILDRYPGSNSPMAYESEVILIDEEAGIREPKRIYMNNVLDYRGYRFFQSSYDQDEKGTILSVSYDRLGKWVTYISYTLLMLGFLIPYFKKNSRFNTLRRRIKDIRALRKAPVVIALLAIGLPMSAQTSTQNTGRVDKEHLKKFEKLIVQSFAGRFQPVHTQAIDVVHKVSKQHTVTTSEKGKFSASEAYLDMVLDPQYWRRQAIIEVENDAVKGVIGISGTHASFNDFFNERGGFKLSQYSEVAFRKNSAEHTKFDKAIIKTNEQLNILAMAFNGDMLRIFPGENLENYKWLAPTDSLAFLPIQGKLSIINDDLRLEPFNYFNIFTAYINAVRAAKIDGNYSKADRILGYIKSIQRQSTAAYILPSETKLHMEVHYNNARIFIFLKYVYMILSVILLSLTFAENLKVRKSKILYTVTNMFIWILGLGFLYHTYGMGLRWYLAGHAPWSNGYEALILVAWGAVLAGFVFVKYSRISLAATALLGFFVLLTAGFSTYDPQLTPLQPVLDSYWLIIHVVTMVVSYGFLGLGFILGIINLLLYILKKEENRERMNLTIRELTNINELNIQIGLFLAVAGTFLGAVWANESWGRYWGWDAKETWALIILFVYAVITHMRHLPKFNDVLYFNIASVVGFSSVLMTFFGVNYYLTKGMHSYAADDKAVFPFYAWVIIFTLLALITAAVVRDKYILKEEKMKTK